MKKYAADQQRNALIAASNALIVARNTDAHFVRRLSLLMPICKEVDTVFWKVDRQTEKKGSSFTEKDLDILSSLLLSDDVKDQISFARSLVKDAARTVKVLAKMKARLAKAGVK